MTITLRDLLEKTKGKDLDSPLFVECEGYSNPVELLEWRGNQLVISDDCGVEELESVVENDVVPSSHVFRKQYFHIDGFNQIFEGFTEGETWNGWATPYFPYEVAAQVIKEINGETSFDAKKDAFMVQFDEAEEVDIFTGQLIKVDNQEVKVYSIGAGSWVWDTCQSLEEWGEEYELTPVIQLDGARNVGLQDSSELLTVEIQEIEGNIIKGIYEQKEYLVDDSKLLRKLKMGDLVEGPLLNGKVIAENIVFNYKQPLKFHSIEKASRFLGDAFGYSTEELEENHIVVTTSDHKKETFTSSFELFKMANDLWETAKDNGLSTETINQVEEEYK